MGLLEMPPRNRQDEVSALLYDIYLGHFQESAAALAAMQVGLEEKPKEVFPNPMDEEEEPEKDIAFEVIDSADPARPGG